MNEHSVSLRRERSWRQAVKSLENPDFRLFWLSTLFSFTGMQMGQVVRGWLVYEITDSPSYLGLVSAVAAIPMVLFSLPGGVVADRVAKRNLLVVTQVSMGVIAFGLAALITTGWIQPWHIVASSFLSGLTLAFNMPGRQAMVTELVKPEQVMNAIAVNSAAANLTRIVAPSVAGVLVGFIGLDGAYYVYAACYVFVVITLLMVPRGLSYRLGQTTLQEEAIDALKFIRANPILVTLLLLGIVPAFFAMPYQMLMPVFARDVLHSDASGLGVLMGVSGIGAFVGSIAVAMMGESNRKGFYLLLAGLGFGGTLVLFGLSSDFGLSMIVMALVGAASTSFMAINNTLILALVPDELRGRIMGVYATTFGLMPLGSLPAGLLADMIGAPATVMLGGSITALLVLGAALFVPSIRKL